MQCSLAIILESWCIERKWGSKFHSVPFSTVERIRRCPHRDLKHCAVPSVGWKNIFLCAKVVACGLPLSDVVSHNRLRTLGRNLGNLT